MNWKVQLILFFTPISLILPQIRTIVAGGELFYPNGDISYITKEHASMGQQSDSTYVKGQTLYPDGTPIEHSLDYQIKTFDDYLKATGQTNNGEFETQFITSVQDNTDNKNVTNLEALTDLEETRNSGQLAIKYRLPNTTNVDVKIYNVLGQKVKDFNDETQNPGNYHTHWNYTNDNGQKVANGFYVYVVQTDQGAIINKFNYVDGHITPGKGTTVEAQKIEQSRTSFKTNGTNTYKITFTDPTETVRNTTFQTELPNEDLDLILKELIQYDNQPFNLTEGDTLQIPLDDINIKTGEVKDAYVDHPDLESFIAENILNIYNKDTNFSGTRTIPLTIVAPHDSDSTLYIDADWQDMTNFTFTVQDIVNDDGTVYTPTQVIFDTNPNTIIDDKIFNSDANGDLSGKLPPGTYRVQVTNDDMWEVFKVEADDQNVVYHANA